MSADVLNVLLTSIGWIVVLVAAAGVGVAIRKHRSPNR